VVIFTHLTTDYTTALLPLDTAGQMSEPKHIVTKMVGNMTKYLSLCAVGALLLTGACAKSPDQIEAAYVSPTAFSGLSCRQIVSERNRVVEQVNQMSAAQAKKASNDKAAVGVGAILFWPALFALNSGSDLEPQIAQLKGNYDALTAAGEQKNCF
jgi:hypothetical protein